MTGNDLYKRTLGLLGYLNSNMVSANKDNLLKRATDIINQICSDLRLPSISKLSDKIEANALKTDALIYGTAMLIALTEGDGAKNELFASLYNQKRAAALSQIEIVEDKLPVTSDGVD